MTELSETTKQRALPWFLASGALNAMFASLVFGSVLLLFLNELGLPKGQIGVLLSLFPFCGLVALGFAPVATRLGWKRVFLACYGSRKVVMACVLFLPMIVLLDGRLAALVFLYGIIALFAILRALAETAYYPWSQQFIPNRQRGRWGAYNSVLATVGSCLAVLLAGRVIAAGHGLTPYLALLGGGAAVGLVGVSLMACVPGGEPRAAAVDSAPHLANLLDALRDRNLRAYLGGLGALTMGTMLFITFLPLYVKEQVGLAPGTVVALDAVALAGGALASLFCGWATDRVGSRPVLMPASAALLLIPAIWLLVPRQAPHPVVWCGSLYFLYGAAAAGMSIAAVRLLFNGVVPPAKSTAYTAIYYAWMGVTGGVAPLLAGGILSACADWQTQIGPCVADGHSVLFVLALGFTGLGWWLCSRIRPDDRYTTRSLFRQVLARMLQSPAAYGM